MAVGRVFFPQYNNTVKETPVGVRTDSAWNDRTTYLETAFSTGRNILINGTSKYLNFNTVVGSSGYGIRDNSGAMEFKNSGGTWTGIGTGGGGGGGGSDSNWVWDGASTITLATSTNLLSIGNASTTAISGTTVCIGTVCKTAWPTGGTGSISTSSALTAGLLVQSTAWNTIANIATNTLNLDTSSFASPNISQWTNDAGYATGNSLWASTTANDGIYYNQGKVGIGTSTPNAQLHISSSSNPTILLTDLSASSTISNISINNTQGSFTVNSKTNSFASSSILMNITPISPNIIVGTTSEGVGADIAIGVGAYSNLSANFTHFGPNIAIGLNAGHNIQPITVAQSNNSLGNSAYYLTAIGQQALENCTSCSENTAVGGGALGGLTNSFYDRNNPDTSVGAFNSAFGIETGLFLGTTSSTTPSSFNALFGNYAMEVGQGSKNTMLGTGAGFHLNGDSNVIVGNYAAGGLSTKSGSQNTLIGGNAYSLGLHSIDATSTVNNTLIGYRIFSNASSTSNNTGIGWQAGYNITYGNNNLLLGYQVGNSLTTGSNNILLGYNVDLPATISNSLNIGNLLYGTNLTNFTSPSTNLSSGNIGIGTTTPLSKLTVDGDLFIEGSNRYINFGIATGTNSYGFYDNGGTLQYKNSGGSWTNVNSGGGAPGGSSGNIQFNSTTTPGSFAGDSHFQILSTDKGHIWINTNDFGSLGTIQTNQLIISPTSTPFLKTGVADFNLDNVNLLTIGAHGASNFAGIRTYFSRGTTDAPTATQANDYLLSLTSQGYGDVDYGNTSNTAIFFKAEGNYSSTTMPSYINFYTTPINSITKFERMRISSNGNIGISTSTPATALDINGTLTIEGTKNATCLSTDNNGLVTATSCGAGGTGVGTISTSTTPTISNLSYWTGTGWPSTLGTVATTSLTATAPLALSQPISVIGGTASAITCTSASGSAAGCLASADWTTFNNKISSTSLSSTLTGLTYTAATGVFSATAGYGMASDAEKFTWNNKWDLASSTIPVNKGGTGSTTLSGILKGNGTNMVATAVAADFPTLNQNTTGTAVATSDSTWTLHNSYPAACTGGQVASGIGDTMTCISTSTNANTASAFDHDPSACSPGQVATDIAANGTLTCVATSTNANTATALAADPADCGANTWANAINASGTLTCGAVTYSGITAMTSSNFDGLISDNTGSGKVVFDTSPTLVTPILGYASSTQLTVSSNMWLTNLATAAGTFLAVNASGQVIATSTPAVGGSGTVTSIATTYPITGGTITTTGTIALSGMATTSLTASTPLALSQAISVIGGTASALTIADAAADATTKGASTYTANDFDSSSGVISLDYANGQNASASAHGFLSDTNWNTFNNKISSTSLSSTFTGLTYTAATGVFSATSGYSIPTDTSQASWNNKWDLASTTIGVAYGGTGSTTLSGILKGAGTGIMATAVAGTDYVLPSVTTLSSLVSIGTITTGTWNADAIGVAKGGTTLTTFTSAGRLLYSSGASTWTSVASSTAGYYLGINDTTGNPEWQTVHNIASSTNPTINATNDIGINTTSASSSVEYWDGAQRSLFPDIPKVYPYASSTLSYIGGYSATGTTTIPWGCDYRPETVLWVKCTTDVGTALLQVGSGTASTTNSGSTIACSTTGTPQTPTSNNTFVGMGAGCKYFGIGTKATDPNIITISIQLRQDHF